jgi:hypothetical protein
LTAGDTNPFGSDVPSADAAIKLLQSESNQRQEKGAAALSQMKPDDAHRNMILNLLRPHLDESVQKRRTIFVEAYAQWATPDNARMLRVIMESPADDPHAATGAEPGWTAACVALLRMNPRAAADAINLRVDSQFFRTNLIEGLRPLTEINSPTSPIAQHFVKQLEDYRDGDQIKAE